MARQARIMSKSNCYHIIMQGNNRSYIYEKNQDKQYFMDILEKLEDEGEFEVMAWCLMDNHVHLVIKTKPEKLDTAFKRLNIKYAKYWNRSKKSTGHVFQGRYMSEPVETDESLMNVIRYIHNNPVKAKMINGVGKYKWSSYKTYFHGPTKEAMRFVWRLFDKNKNTFKKFHKENDYEEYLEIKEDQQRIREENAQDAIQKTCDKYGIVEGDEIFSHPDILKEIVKEISKRSRMSGRKIAALLGVSETTVRRIRKNAPK